MSRAFGCLADKGDQRDFLHRPTAVRLPAHVDLSAHMPPVMDQGQLGSCVAHATTAAFRFDLLRQAKPDFPASRIFPYYNARSLEGTVASDSGVEIRDGLKSLAKWGVCSESDSPYLVSAFAKKPAPKCYTDAKGHQALVYERVNLTPADLKGTLAGGLPIVLGISVYESFESDAIAKTGTVPMPKRDEALLGGHAVLAIGYSGSRVRCRNSWSAEWGQRGDFTLPIAYLLDSNLCSDAWVLRSVEG